MANLLTGDYEAVLQIAIRQINGLLGTLHQNGARQDAALQVPHSSTGRIGDPPRKPHVGGFEDWVVGFQRASPGRGLQDLQAQLTAAAPPGVALMLTDAFTELDESWGIRWPTKGVVRGLTNLQVASPTITVPEGSSSEVTVNAGIRAHYYPDSGTLDLPAPVHGEVEAAFEVRVSYPISLDRPLPRHATLFIAPSSQDAKIQFHAAPGSGVSAGGEAALAAQVRKALREDLTLLPVGLPRGFPFTIFKGLGTGSSQAIALPFQLSGAAPPASGVQPLTQSFIDSSGFAVAVSKEYVTGLFDQAVEAIRAGINGQPVEVPVGPWTITYHLRFTSGPTLTFQTGTIEISGEVTAERQFLPDGWVRFKQPIVLVFDSPSRSFIIPMRYGEPDVSERFVNHQQAVDMVRTQIQAALDANKQAVRDLFDQGRANLVGALRTFDPVANVSYTGVEITPDGVIVRSEIGSAARRPPVVDIAETHGSMAFTAFQSWIPAGRIDRFIWSWVEHPPYTKWGVVNSFTDEHRFIFPKPAAATQLSQICLRIEGTQTLPGGQEVSVVAGTTCHVPVPEFEIDVPSWWQPVTLPIWQPGVTDTTVLRNAIAAHVSVQVNVPAKEPLAQNTLVYFADWEAEKPLDALSAALGRVRNSSALGVIVVLPAGAFDASRREIESKLASSDERRALVQFTEDDEDGWTRMFAVIKRPSACLVNARREFVWKHEGEPDPADLAAALDQHAVPTSAPRFRPLRLTISPGDPAPDVFFETDAREQYAVHRFRGQKVLLNFWQSWSAPCLTELGRLQRLYEARKDAPFIVAFHGGKNSDALEDIRNRLGLSFALVQDSQQQIARQYGVRCWPTTISVDADGRIQQVQFGIGHEQLAPSGNQKPAVQLA
jgi:peroxiredoxin